MQFERLEPWQSLAPGGDNKVVRENAGWSSSPRAQGSLLLMLGVLRRIGQHGGRYDQSTVKRRERDRERERENLNAGTDCTRVCHMSVNVLTYLLLFDIYLLIFDIYFDLESDCHVYAIYALTVECFD